MRTLFLTLAITVFVSPVTMTWAGNEPAPSEQVQGSEQEQVSDVSQPVTQEGDDFMVESMPLSPLYPPSNFSGTASDLHDSIQDSDQPVAILVNAGAQDPDSGAFVGAVRQYTQNAKGQLNVIQLDLGTQKELIEAWAAESGYDTSSSSSSLTIYRPHKDHDGNLFGQDPAYVVASDSNLSDLRKKMEDVVNLPNMDFSKDPVVLGLQEQQAKIQADIKVLEDFQHFDVCSKMARDHYGAKQDALVADLAKARSQILSNESSLVDANDSFRTNYFKLPAKIQMHYSFEDLRNLLKQGKLGTVAQDMDDLLAPRGLAKTFSPNSGSQERKQVLGRVIKLNAIVIQVAGLERDLKAAHKQLADLQSEFAQAPTYLQLRDAAPESCSQVLDAMTDGGKSFQFHDYAQPSSVSGRSTGSVAPSAARFE